MNDSKDWISDQLMANDYKTIGIRFGALCDPIKDQLKEQGIKLSKMKLAEVARIQIDADAAVRLKLRGLITDGEQRRTESKLMKKIIAIIKSDL